MLEAKAKEFLHKTETSLLKLRANAGPRCWIGNVERIYYTLWMILDVFFEYCIKHDLIV